MSALLDRGTPFLLIAVGCFTTFGGMLSDDAVLQPLQVACGIAGVACGAFVLGCQRTRDAFANAFTALDPMPKSVVLHQDDGGGMHAFITTVGGDVRTIVVPEELADSPDQVVAYVLAVIADEIEADDA